MTNFVVQPEIDDMFLLHIHVAFGRGKRARLSTSNSILPVNNHEVSPEFNISTPHRIIIASHLLPLIIPASISLISTQMMKILCPNYATHCKIAP